MPFLYRFRQACLAVIGMTVPLAVAAQDSLRVLRFEPSADGILRTPIVITFDQPVAPRLQLSVNPDSAVTVVPRADAWAYWRNPSTLARPARHPTRLDVAGVATNPPRPGERRANRGAISVSPSAIAAAARGSRSPFSRVSDSSSYVGSIRTDSLGQARVTLRLPAGRGSWVTAVAVNDGVRTGYATLALPPSRPPQ
jgi:hypothetical protein